MPDNDIHMCTNFGCFVINCVLFIVSRVSVSFEEHHLPQLSWAMTPRLIVLTLIFIVIRRLKESRRGGGGYALTT